MTTPHSTGVALQSSPTNISNTLSDYITDQILLNKRGVGLNLTRCLPEYFPEGWGYTHSNVGFVMQLAIKNRDNEIKYIRSATLNPINNNVIYTPPKIQQLNVGNNSWVRNLPSNVNVIHANMNTGTVFVLGTSDTELDINWSLPITAKVAADNWTGVSYALPNNYRVLAYDHTTKGICVLVRSTDTTTDNNIIAPLDFQYFNNYIQSI
jgi:hypothetical protein